MKQSLTDYYKRWWNKNTDALRSYGLNLCCRGLWDSLSWRGVASMSKASISVRDTWCLHTDRGQVVTRIVNCRLNDLCAFTQYAFTTTRTMVNPLREIEWPWWKGSRFMQSCVLNRKKKKKNIYIIIDKISKSISDEKWKIDDLRFPSRGGFLENQFFIRVTRKSSDWKRQLFELCLFLCFDKRKLRLPNRKSRRLRKFRSCSGIRGIPRNHAVSFLCLEVLSFPLWRSRLSDFHRRVR